MVHILTQKKALLAYLLAASLALFFLFQSGISSDYIFKPMTASAKTISNGFSGINVLYLLLFILLLPLAYSILCLYSVSTEEVDLTVAVAPLILSLNVFFYLGLSLPSLLISVGLVLSAFFAHYSSFRDKECYKKISYYAVSSKATKRAIFLLNLFIILSVFLLLPKDPVEIQKNFENDLSGPLNDTLPGLQSSLMDGQKQQIHSMLKSIEAVLLVSSEQTPMPSLTPEEKIKCSSALKDNMQKIDADAKALLDAKFEEQKNASISTSLIPQSLMNQLSLVYPLFVIFSLFFTLEMFRIFSGIISGFCGMFLGRLVAMPSSPEPSQSSTPDMGSIQPFASSVAKNNMSVDSAARQNRYSNSPPPNRSDPYYHSHPTDPRYRNYPR